MALPRGREEDRPRPRATRGRLSGGSALLFYPGTLLLLLIFSFLASPPEALVCRTCVPVHVCARARVCALCWLSKVTVGDSSWRQQQKHQL